MHAFITGATGFLGQHLLEQLVAQNWKVTALYRESSQLKQAHHLHSKIQWEKGCLEDIASLRQAMPQGVDAVFHLAGNTSTWGVMHRRQYQTNVIGTQNIAQVALEKNAIRFIHTSSASVYGFHKDVIDELSEMRGIDNPVAYYRSKFLAEEALREIIKKGLDAVILNPCAIIGPGDKNNWGQVFELIEKEHLPWVPPGHKSFCFAEDVAKAHIQAFVHGKTAENYILSGPSASLLQIFQWTSLRLNKTEPHRSLPSWAIKFIGYINSTLSHFSRKEPKISWDKAQIICANTIFSHEKASRELQYRCNKSLEDMLELSFQWWQSNRRSPSVEHNKHPKNVKNAA